MKNNTFLGVMLIILGLGLIGFGVFTLINPLFATGFPLFMGAIAAGCCSVAVGCTEIRARVLSKPFIFLTVVSAAVFFVWSAIHLLT